MRAQGQFWSLGISARKLREVLGRIHIYSKPREFEDDDAHLPLAGRAAMPAKTVLAEAEGEVHRGTHPHGIRPSMIPRRHEHDLRLRSRLQNRFHVRRRDERHISRQREHGVRLVLTSFLKRPHDGQRLTAVGRLGENRTSERLSERHRLGLARDEENSIQPADAPQRREHIGEHSLSKRPTLTRRERGVKPLLRGIEVFDRNDGPDQASECKQARAARARRTAISLSLMKSGAVKTRIPSRSIASRQ